MRWLWLFLLGIFAILGMGVAALNPGTVHYDLAFVQLNIAKGTALLVVLILGWLLGGLTAWIGMRVSRRRPKPGVAHGVGATTPTDDP